MTTKTTLFIAILISTISFSQPAIEWQDSFGGSSSEYGEFIFESLDGGFVIASQSRSNDGDVVGGHGRLDYWVFKLSNTGGILWQMPLGGGEDDELTSFEQTSDGGYVVAGFTRSNDGDVIGFHGNVDYWVVKLTSSGLLEWQKPLGGSGFEYGEWIEQTSDGGYIVAGYSDSIDGDITNNHGAGDYWIVKLTPTGDIDWQKSLGGSNFEHAYSILQTTDGGYVIGGDSLSSDGDVTGHHGSTDYWIVKLNTLGNIEWEKSLGGSSADYNPQIIQTLDGGFIVGGDSYSNDGDVIGHHGSTDYWIVKLTDGGEMEWQIPLGGSENDYLTSVQQTLDGGYIVLGNSYSNDGNVIGSHGNRDYFVVKLTSSGTVDWQKPLGGSNDDKAFFIQETAGDGFIVGGYSYSNDGNVTNNFGEGDCWIVKLSTAGVIEWQESYGGSLFDGALSISNTMDGYIFSAVSDSNDGDVTGNNGGRDFWGVKLSPVLDVSENKLNNSIILSPNPNTGKFTLSFSEDINVTSLTIVDTLGRTVYSESNIPSGTIEIGQNFNAGVYFVKVSSITLETTLKMIVD